MSISELIKELEEQMKLHGNVEVDVYASTDCGYSGGGGDIEEIEFGKVYRYVIEPGGGIVRKQVPGIILCNNEG